MSRGGTNLGNVEHSQYFVLLLSESSSDSISFGSFLASFASYKPASASSRWAKT